MSGRGKHEKEYFKHEVKTTHFRAWKSGKKWLYGASALTLILGSTSGAFAPLFDLSHIDLQTAEVNAATTTQSSLTVNGNVPATNGEQFTQGLTSSNLAQSNWGSALVDSISAAISYQVPSWSGTTWNANLPLSGNNHYAILPYGSIINMASPLTVSITETGDSKYSQGFYFVPAGTSSATLQTYADQSKYPGSLGIAGIPNAIFAGRDYWNDSSQGDNSLAMPSTLQSTTAGTQMRIATTDSSTGKLIASSSAFVVNNTSTTTNVGGPINDASTSTAGETLQVQWTPTAVVSYKSNGQPATVTGNMILTVGRATVTYNGLVAPAQMNMGINALHGNLVTSGSASASASNNPSFAMASGTLIANQTSDVTVNYVGSNGKLLGSSTINAANYGDKIGVVASAPTTDDGNTYDYLAPSFAGYTFAGPVSVQVNAATNSLTVNYTASTQTAYYNQAWAFNGWGNGLSNYQMYPASVTSTGPIDTAITPTAPNPAPLGWHYIAVKAGGGNSYYGITHTATTNGTLGGSTQYATPQAAMAAAFAASSNPNYSLNGLTSTLPDSGNGINSGQYYLEADQQTATFSQKDTAGASVGTAFSFNQGTGAYVGLNYSGSGYTGTFASSLTGYTPPQGYKFKSVTTPDGNTWYGVIAGSYTAPTAATATSAGTEGSVKLMSSPTDTTGTTFKIAIPPYTGVVNSDASNFHSVPSSLDTGTAGLLEAVGLVYTMTTGNGTAPTPSNSATATQAGQLANPGMVITNSNQFTINLAQIVTGRLQYVAAQGKYGAPGAEENTSTASDGTPGGGLVGQPWGTTSLSGGVGDPVFTGTSAAAWPALPAGYSVVSNELKAIVTSASGQPTWPPTGITTSNPYVPNAGTTPSVTPLAYYQNNALVSNPGPVSTTFGNVWYTWYTSTTPKYGNLTTMSTIQGQPCWFFVTAPASGAAPTTVSSKATNYIGFRDASGNIAVYSSAGISSSLTGTSTPEQVLQAAFPNYASGDNTYSVALTANALTWKWHFAYQDGSDPSGLPGGGQPMTVPTDNFGVVDTGSILTGLPVNNQVQNFIATNGALDNNNPQAFVSGYQIEGDSTIYSSWSALAAVYPYLPASASAPTLAKAITVLVGTDKSAIHTVYENTASPAGIPANSAFTPTDYITASSDFDGSDADNNKGTVNGSPVLMEISDSDFNSIFVPQQEATQSIPAGTLPVGEYTIWYDGLNYPGQAAYETYKKGNPPDPSLTGFYNYCLEQDAQNNPADSGGTWVSSYWVLNTQAIQIAPNFALPFTGGEGTIGLLGLTTALAAGAFLIKRRKAQDEESLTTNETAPSNFRHSNNKLKSKAKHDKGGK